MLPFWKFTERMDTVNFWCCSLSPLKPELAVLAAGRLLLSELDCLSADRVEFANKSTLGRPLYIQRLTSWKKSDHLEIVCLSLPSPLLTLRHIATRVKHSGQDVPRDDVVRRIGRAWKIT